MDGIHRWIAVVSCSLMLGGCADNLDVASTPTEVQITAPTWSSVLAGTVTVAATVSGDAPVTGVLFTLAGVTVGAEDIEPPFETDFDTRGWANGDYFLEARALTADGFYVRSSKVYVSIVNSGTLRVRVTVPSGDEGPVASTLMIDKGSAAGIPAAGGTLDVAGIAPGRHWVDLVQPRYDCTTVPGIAADVDIVADETTTLEIEVECSAVPNLEIAFAANGDIFRARLDGGGVVNVTNSPSRSEASPDWSPDGARLTYVVGFGEDVVIANADGSEEKPLNLPDGNKSRPTWSPDGSQILFANDSTQYEWWEFLECSWYCGMRHRLYLVPAGGGAPTPLALDENLWDGNFDDLPAGWSPDGSRIVHERDTGFTCFLSLLDPAADPAVADPLPPVWAGCANGSADWGADDRIAFTVPGSGGSDLATIYSDGTGLTVLQKSIRVEESHPHWTPDGQWLVFLEDGRITVTGADGFGRYHALQQFEVESLSLVP
jgi:hypothetical protein